MPSPAWLNELFTELRPGQIQAGYSYDVAQRIDDTGRERGYYISPVPRRTPGTRIPAPTIMKFASGQWKPRIRSLVKLRAFYERWNYARMRAEGFDRKTANSFRRSHPAVVKNQINIHNRIKQQIFQREYLEDIASGADEPVTIYDIEYGMMLSDKETAEDWDTYIKTGKKGKK